MITVLSVDGDRLIPCAFDTTTQVDKTLWIDLLNPTQDEEKQIEKWLNIAIPTRDDMVEIEESSRFYIEDGAQFLTAPFIHVVEGEKRTIAPITFILVQNHLITVRYAEPKAISLFVTRVAKSGNGIINTTTSGSTIMLALIESATDRLADLLEAVAARIEKASHTIFHRSPKARPMTTSDFRHMLTQIGGQGTFLSMVRESIAGISRLLVYCEAFAKVTGPKHDLKATIKSLERDTQSLEHYADFLSSKMTFLLDTVVGMISTEQNAIIKIFSVAAVGFMPPTLIASIYGMNFHFMPELNEKWGYPLAILLMIISALLPLLYFRKKGWL